MDDLKGKNLRQVLLCFIVRGVFRTMSNTCDGSFFPEMVSGFVSDCGGSNGFVIVMEDLFVLQE